MAQGKIHPRIERDGNIIIMNTKEFLPESEVDKDITDLEEFLKNSKSSVSWAIILNFSQLSSTEMTVEQMARFVDVVVKYKIINVVSIPPAQNVPGSKQVISLLNKSLPIFGKKGIWVLIVDSVEKAKSRVKSCFNPTDAHEKIKIQIVGRFEGKSINNEVALTFSINPTLIDIFNELNKTFQITALTPNAMLKEKFYVILNGSRVSSIEIEQILSHTDRVSIIQNIP